MAGYPISNASKELFISFSCFSRRQSPPRWQPSRDRRRTSRDRRRTHHDRQQTYDDRSTGPWRPNQNSHKNNQASSGSRPEPGPGDPQPHSAYGSLGPWVDPWASNHRGGGPQRAQFRSQVGPQAPYERGPGSRFHWIPR